MKHIKLFENTNIDPFDDNWFENEEQEIKKYEIRYYEIGYDAGIFDTPDYVKSEYVEGTLEQIDKYITSKKTKEYTTKKLKNKKWIDVYIPPRQKYKKPKKGYIGWDYISNNGGIKIKEYKIKFRKLKNK